MNSGSRDRRFEARNLLLFQPLCTSPARVETAPWGQLWPPAGFVSLSGSRPIKRSEPEFPRRRPGTEATAPCWKLARGERCALIVHARVKNIRLCLFDFAFCFFWRWPQHIFDQIPDERMRCTIMAVFLSRNCDQAISGRKNNSGSLGQKNGYRTDEIL